MKARWMVIALTGALLLVASSLAATVVMASPKGPSSPQISGPRLHRCATDYEDEEIAEMQANGEDGYEPDDCPLLAHTLTGPMGLNFCQPGDEDWAKFKALPNLLYQIRAEPSWNYPTEPHLELIQDGNVVAQNDHYFGNNAEVWWWNGETERIRYIRMTELRGRADCGNSAYTLSLHLFAENPYPQAVLPPSSTPVPTATPTQTPTVTPMPASTLTPDTSSTPGATPTSSATSTPGA